MGLQSRKIFQPDNAYDNVSNLNREGIFRINVGISEQTFARLFPDTQNNGI
ncbi:DUF6194 family protein [Mucilaginibacter koreensis]